MPDRDLEYSAVLATPAYGDFVRARRRLVWPLAIGLIALLMLLTALAVFTTVLDGEIVPGLNGNIVAAYVVFFVPVIAAHFYVRRAPKVDRLAARAIEQAQLGDGERS